MYGLVYLKESKGEKAKLVNKLVISSLRSLEMVDKSVGKEIQEIFDIPYGSCLVQKLGTRQDPFSTARRPKMEYGLKYSNVNYLCPTDSVTYSGLLFSISYDKNDLNILSKSDEIFRKINFMTEEEVASKEIRTRIASNREILFEEDSPSMEVAPKKAKLIMAKSRYDEWNSIVGKGSPTISRSARINSPEASPLTLSNTCLSQVHSDAFGELSDMAMNESSMPVKLHGVTAKMSKNCVVGSTPIEYILDPNNNNVTVLSAETLSLELVNKNLYDVQKSQEEIKTRLDKQEMALHNVESLLQKILNELTNGKQSKNVIEISGGFSITKTAYNEALKCTRVEKAAIPLFEALFTCHEKMNMRIKGKDGQESIDLSRLNAIYKTIAKLESVQRFPGSHADMLNEQEQKLVKAAIGSLLNAKRQRQKQKMAKECTIPEQSQSLLTDMEADP